MSLRRQKCSISRDYTETMSNSEQTAIWPPDYDAIQRERLDHSAKLLCDQRLIQAARIYYSSHPVEFIERYLVTYDPRNVGSGKPSTMPFVLFPRQKEFVLFLQAMVENRQNGLCEKARDMGATWVCVAFSVWLLLFKPGSSVGWGSRKENLVDKLGDADSIFEKIRIALREVPPCFLPKGFSDSDMGYMKILNRENGSSITGESGDNIGRGGRKLMYFKDEAAFYERPEKIEAALGDTTNTQIDISSVNGLGNVFHRRRESGVEWDGTIHPGRTHVFVMDWSDNPLKSQAWYDQRRAKAVSEGMLHVFESEVNRRYDASVEGILIPGEWVAAAIDAHIKLGFDDDGGYCAGLDVADEGMDTNAQALRKGVILRSVDEWAERDTGATARRSVAMLSDLGGCDVQYDCIGVGAGVKAEVNRLDEDGLIPSGLQYVPWNAGAGVENPDDYVIEGDTESPINKDFYTNLKAQAGWQLRLRFERTFKAVTEGIDYPSDELISIDSTIPLLRKIQKELSQSTVGRGTKLKLLINKTPEGTKSPNLADAISMCYFPLETDNYTLDNL